MNAQHLHRAIQMLNVQTLQDHTIVFVTVDILEMERTVQVVIDLVC